MFQWVHVCYNTYAIIYLLAINPFGQNQTKEQRTDMILICIAIRLSSATAWLVPTTGNAPLCGVVGKAPARFVLFLFDTICSIRFLVFGLR